MNALATSCKNCTKKFTPRNHREFYEKSCPRCLKRVDRAIRDIGWKPNHKGTISDADLWKHEKPLPGVFWVPGKKKKKKGFEKLYRMRED